MVHPSKDKPGGKLLQVFGGGKTKRCKKSRKEK
jgi:hypothetical protein